MCERCQEFIKGAYLNDMAKEGLLLVENGFHNGLIAKFYKTDAPQNIRYRLEAGKNNGPDEEARALYQKYGWNYLVDRVSFHIFYAIKGEGRELNTDAKVQSISMSAFVKACFLSLLLYVGANSLHSTNLFRDGVFITFTRIQFWRILVFGVFVLWFVLFAISDFIVLFRQWNKLRKGVYRKRNIHEFYDGTISYNFLTKAKID